LKKFVLAVAVLALVACSGQQHGVIDATPAIVKEVKVVEVIEVKIDFSILTENIYFDFDKDELTDESIAILTKKVIWLKKHKDIDLVIEGHCDKRGTGDYNLDLGMRRAERARDFLMENGIDPARMELETYNSDVLADASNHSMNRRCEFIPIN